MIENQSLQSMFQLAVALNIGFSAIVAFRGNSISREQDRIESLLQSAKLYKEASIEASQYEADARSTFNKAIILKQKITEEILDYDNLTFKIIRTAAAIFALLSFIFLFYVSLKPNNIPSSLLIFGSIVVNIPVIGYIFYTFYRSLFKLRPLRTERIALDKEVADGLLNALH
ncbi:hypothetical protein [Breoghania sp.]|uniref:hypothetical protein n=1 Tax=Breoghania sp. TaxID=2065378 RepID=UPI0029CA7033|nr:hypothetical protein [Breoghania sp.]